MNLQFNKSYIPWGLLLMTGLALVSLKTCTPPAPAPAIVAAQVALPNPSLKLEAKIETPVKTGSVKTYKPSAKTTLPLPAEVVRDDSKQVTSSATVPSKEERQIVTQVIDARTGDTEVYVSGGGHPWLALENRGTVSLDYGYKAHNSSPVGRINIRQDLVQIKQLHLGWSASAYSDGDYFVGIGGSYRW